MSAETNGLCNKVDDQNESNTKGEETVLDQIKNLDLAQLVRGSTPDNIDSICLRLCHRFLATPRWLQATCQDIKVNRIFGGLTNQLYSVELVGTDDDDDSAVKNGDDPRKVAIKLYEKKHDFLPLSFDPLTSTVKGEGKEEERLLDNIVLAIVSQLDITPKVYGLFNGGLVQEYCEVSFRFQNSSNSNTLFSNSTKSSPLTTNPTEK